MEPWLNAEAFADHSQSAVNSSSPLNVPSVLETTLSNLKNVPSTSDDIKQTI
jgi:hypothetical protein